MKLSSLNELFLHELRDLYDAEHQLIEALPKMVKAATDTDLKAAFESHLGETRKQVTRLKEVFAECGETPERETCAGMKGLIKEGEKIMDDADEPTVLDAGLIAAAQKIEHYEIATYGTLISWAEAAGFTSVRLLLEQSLEEEKEADMKLTEIAETCVNASAEQEDGAPEDGSEEEAESTPHRTTSSTAAPNRSAPNRSRSSTPARSGRTKK